MEYLFQNSANGVSPAALLSRRHSTGFLEGADADKLDDKGLLQHMFGFPGLIFILLGIVRFSCYLLLLQPTDAQFLVDHFIHGCSIIVMIIVMEICIAH